MSTGGQALVDAINNSLNAPPSALAFIFKGEHISWGRMQNVARAVQYALEEGGVHPSAPVAIVPRTRPGFFAALMGLMASSRPVKMIYGYQSASAIANDIRRRLPAAIIAGGGDWSPELIQAAKELGCCGVSLENGVDQVESVEGLERAAGVAAEQRMGPRMELLTSGTTGAPKTFPMSYELIARSMLAEAVMAPNSGDKPSSLLYFPLGNISGVYNFVATVKTLNASVMLEKFTIEGWAEFVRTYRPESISMPPAGVRMALDANIPKEDLSSLKYIGSGAAPIDPAAHREFEAKYGVLVLTSYGATEFGGPVTFMTVEDRKKWGSEKIDSAGRAWAGSKIRVIDPDTGEEVPPDALGVLEVSAPRVGPEWIRTTDLGRVDTDGFVYLCGRTDGAINRGGFKIIPTVVEQALAAHPAIAAACVVGVPDSRLGEAPAAMVELRPGAAPPSAEELERHVRANVPATFVPVLFEIVSELPRTPSMKVAVSEIRKILTERRN